VGRVDQQRSQPMIGARDRNRTGTPPLSKRRILSLLTYTQKYRKYLIFYCNKVKCVVTVKSILGE